MMKKNILPLICLTAIGFMACTGSDDSGKDDNPILPNSSASVPYVDPNAGVLSAPSSSPSEGNTPVMPPASGAYAQLSPKVNSAMTAALFNNWKAGHFSTLENDRDNVYPSIAADFGDVFTEAYLPAGRIVWSAQSSSGYKNKCSVDDAAIRTMKFRACTVSEGIGYGLLLAYFQDDLDMFYRLWNYSRAYRAYQGRNLMPWIVKDFTYDVIDVSSATDADLDIATALILMYYKSQQQVFLDDALSIIGALWDEEIEPSSHRLLSGNTSMWNGKNGKDFTYNLSYFSPVAIRLFAQVDKSHDWNSVLDAMYSYMAAVQAGGTGVFPDWSNSEAVAVNPPNNSAATTWFTFNKESVRIPWRIAWDYYWYQDARAGAVLKTLNDFIVAKSGGDPNSTALSTNYSWNLSLGADITNGVVSSQWYAAWCATGVGSNAAWLEACTDGLNTKNVSNSASSYFSDILLVMYSQLLNGLFVKPF